MQITEYPDGTMIRKLFQPQTEEALREQMKREYMEAMEKGAVDIRQAILNPDLPCPCGSLKKVRNCCIRRLAARQAMETT